ncbi:DUF86 domain-containing protein [Telluribacter sp.]|jgi:uncharacterized protein with HEPN domain|uniref:HepT-like ribonuclease domain-containing protein n=1 Tax=Telluribacter sp. TaxID=1978767 RepID=UPI002E0D797C|nr:HepT-like ribonuclease domain-containing protein [Telluribacter sp.]
MSEKDTANLMAILEACTKIQHFVEGVEDFDRFYEDEKTFDAVLMNFIIIGETVSKLTLDLKESRSRIPWARYKGFRNIVAHNYFGVNPEEVWQIIQGSIPTLKGEIENILQDI